MALLASAAAVSAATHSSSAEGGGSGPSNGAAAAAADHAVGSTSSMDKAGSHGGAAVASAATSSADGLGHGGPAGAAAGSGAAGSSSSSSSTSARVHTWHAIRVGLDGLGLDSTPVSRCRQCMLQLPGPLFAQLPQLRAFLRELRPLLGSSGLAAALAAADDLQALGQLLVAWGVPPEALLLEPLLTPQAEYFSGTLFQVRSSAGSLLGLVCDSRAGVCQGHRA
jgi:hypothetical protein